MKFTHWINSALTVCAMGLTACGGGGGGDSSTASSGFAKLQSIQVKADRTSLEAGASVDLHAIGTFSDGTSVDLGDRTAGASHALTNITWKVSDLNIASVTLGLLETYKVGSVIVTATDSFSSISGSANFTVTAALPKSLGIAGFDTDKTTYSQREARPLSAYVAYSDGKRVTQQAVTWSSSNPAVFTVDANGNFQATGTGTADLTATSGTYTTKMTITIIAPTVPAKVTVSCDPRKPTVISAADWNSQFAQDAQNSSEWVVVDGASCQANPVIGLFVSSGSGTYYRIFSAVRSSSNPTTFLAGLTTTSGRTPQLTAGQSITVGKSEPSETYRFDALYSFKVN